VARIYDLVADPANNLTFTTPEGRGPRSLAFLIPRSRDDLTARRRLHQAVADSSFGLLGRSPDCVASFFAGFAGGAEYFARGEPRFAQHVRDFYARAADDDLFLAHAIIQPTIDRARPAHEQPEPNLYASVLEERDGGIVLQGAQMLATSAVLADFTHVSAILPQPPGAEDYAISVVVPMNALGLRVYPRRPYALNADEVFDYPLTSRFDESDALLVLDHVFVPWEHVFVYRNRELTTGQFFETAAHLLANTQAQIRFTTKLQFLIGLVKRICDDSGQTGRVDVQAQLGDLAARAALVEGLVLAAEASCIVDDYGVARPNPRYAYANQVLQSSLYPEVLQLARSMMGGSMLQVPATAAEFANPQAAADLARYVRWPSAGAEQRVKLLKLLWDLLGSEFAGRHLQYEMFYAGPPAGVKLREFRSYGWTDAEALVDACLEGYDLARQ
jgi:4-hydroxyphenylacetate 3-monooxygenase